MANFTRRTALAMLAAAGAAPKVAAQDIPKIAFMLNGTPGPVGWNYEHARGIDMAKEKYAGRVQIDRFDGVPEWGKGDAEKIQELVSAGYDMIFGCSFGYMKSMIQASFAAPNIKFEHCGGYIQSPNLATYTARWYEGRVPQGILAANMTKTNKVGYIASFPISQILRGINSAYLAARQINPDIEFEVVWLNSWFDPEREEEAARKLLAGGADVLMQHTNSTKPMEVAQELGAFAFGQGSDMLSFGPDAQLTSTINNWGPYYDRRIGALLDGNWTSDDTWGGLDQEMIAMGVLNDRMPNRAVLQAQDAIDQLSNGTVHPFTGPIKRQDGSAWLAPGETASNIDLLTMDFFVEGITSTLPTKS